MSKLIVDQALKTVIETSIIPELEAENAKLRQRLEDVMQFLYSVNIKEKDICYDCLTYGQFEDYCAECGEIVCKQCEISGNCLSCPMPVHKKCKEEFQKREKCWRCWRRPKYQQ